MKKNNVLTENVLRSEKDIQQFKKANKEMEEALKLLPSQEHINYRKLIQLGEISLDRYLVVQEIGKTEDACKHLQRCIQILQDLIRD